MFRKYLVATAAMLALGAFASASASASEWYVGGKALSGTVALSETIKTEENIVMSFDLSTNETIMQVTCTSVRVKPGGKGLEITSPGTLNASRLVLEGCEATKQVAEYCELEYPEIITNALEAKLALGKSPEDLAEFGKAKALWTEFWLDSDCGWGGGNHFVVTGALTVKMPTGQTEATEQELVFENSSGLTWGGNPGSPVYIKGKIKLKLASGAKWSFH
jgi:hypothetical protein